MEKTRILNPKPRVAPRRYASLYSRRLKNNIKMKKFYTEYKHNSKTYGSELFAENWEEAEKQLDSKKETEKVIGYDPTIEYLDD